MSLVFSITIKQNNNLDLGFLVKLIFSDLSSDSETIPQNGRLNLTEVFPVL